MIVKICGITNAEDARQAVSAGADWIGLNLVSGPRKIDLATAQAILAQLNQPARAVALIAMETVLADPNPLNTLRACGVARLQLYGEVTPAAVAQLHRGGFETVLVHAVGDDASLDSLDAIVRTYRSSPPNYVLFDAAVVGKQGGTGRRANWSLLREARLQGRCSISPPMILAGGLTPENVAEAIHAVQPIGVDVSSGVESTPGKKDARKVEAFIQAARTL